MRLPLRATLFAPWLFGGCTATPPPAHDVPVVTPVKSASSIETPPVQSVSPNPPPPAPSAQAEPAPEPPNPDTNLALGNGARVVIDLQPASSMSDPPTLSLELRRDEKVALRREGWDAVTHFDLKKVHPCETWFTRLVREPLGTINAVRVSLICRTGEDFVTSSEIAVLVNPDDLSTLWSGLADTFSNSMDSCAQSRHITFRIIPPKTLEKSIVEETSWHEQVLDESLKARLKRECKVGTKRRVERVALP